MTKEQLLVPRRKLINGYPGCKFKIGTIFILSEKSGENYYHQHTEAEPIHIEENEHEIYPAIFKELQWWEERKPEDLPQYLKVISKFGKGEVGDIILVHNHTPEINTGITFKHKNGNYYGMDYRFVEPATSSEYKTYIEKLNENS